MIGDAEGTAIMARCGCPRGTTVECILKGCYRLRLAEAIDFVRDNGPIR